MGALLAGIGLVQFIGLAISGVGVIVPEIDTLAARHISKEQCYVLHFNRAKTIAVLTSSSP
jgi:hypothetical protein